ncbi:MAG: GtrA family protein [Kiritimatiellae bacterium]|nr:GtrA family protein [Kiritimatiellia bacterium]
MRTKRIIDKATVSEMLRFVAVGGVSFSVDIVTLIILQETLFSNISGGLFISTAIAFLVSLAVHYALTAFWVFREHRVNTVREHFLACVLFVVTNVIGLAINELLLWVGAVRLGFHYVAVKIFAAGVAMVWNFLCQKSFIFAKGEGHEC